MDVIEDLICCPTCKGNLKAASRAGPAQLPDPDTEAYECASCRQRYPMIDSVLDFLPGARQKRTLAQQLMETQAVVARYEGRSWRANPWFTLYAGLSFEEEMAMVLQIISPEEEDTLLDLACGTGLYARSLARQSAQRKVLALDLSWPMLRYGADRVEAQRLANVRFLHGDAHRLPLKASAVDAAVCCGSLHLFADAAKVVAELARVIRFNGRLALAVFFNAVDLWGRFMAPYWETVWGLHPFGKAEMEELLDRAGFAPTIYYSRGIWMIAQGIRKSNG